MKASKFETLMSSIRYLFMKSKALTTMRFIWKSNRLGLLKVSRRHSLDDLQQGYPELYKAEVFERKGSDVYLNSRSFHESVFQSLIDSARNTVEKTIREAKERNNYDVNFQITRKINPPSINLTFIITSTDPDGDGRMNLTALARTLEGTVIQLQSATTLTYRIDVDVVPGLRIKFDTVPNPFSPQETMKCPVYAVFKWRNENQVSSRQSEFGGFVLPVTRSILWMWHRPKKARAT